MPVIASEVLYAEIDPRGATLRALRVGDDRENTINVVATGPDLRYGGATVGRYANRISNARFTLNGSEHRLHANEGEHILHGGPRGFDSVDWDVVETKASRLVLRYISAHGDQGFPGELQVDVTFEIRGADLTIAYAAMTDRDTVVNLSNHSYFNLSGGSRTAAQHRLAIFANFYTPVDDALIPTGEVAPVDGTRYDFRTARAVGDELYDTNWVLSGDAWHPAARLECDASAWRLDIHTSEPGLQMYSGNPKGVALETQHFPDSPNRPSFPSTVLRAGGQFASTTLYRFTQR